MLLSNFAHRRQRRESDCLVACAEMALNHLGVQISYQHLAKILRARSSFTPFSNLQFLEALGLSVTISQGEVASFEPYLESGLPVLVSVQTVGWKHWGDEVTEHAIVVVGVDERNDVIYIHDPFFATAPIELPLLTFEIGWEEKGWQYAVIGLAELAETA
jgi:ABC-type bacteriocin/lantibiotic exporter with double-glycine peptidase domain